MYITFMISDFLTWWLKTTRSSKAGENFASQEGCNCRGVQCILLHPCLSGRSSPLCLCRKVATGHIKRTSASMFHLLNHHKNRHALKLYELGLDSRRLQRQWEFKSFVVSAELKCNSKSYLLSGSRNSACLDSGTLCCVLVGYSSTQKSVTCPSNW